MCSSSWSSSQIHFSSFSPHWFPLWTSRIYILHEISLRLAESRLGEIKYFTLKKGSRMGDHILAWARIAKYTGFFTNSRLGECRLAWVRMAASVSLSRDDFGLSETVLSWARLLWFERPVAHFLPFLLCFLISLLLFLSSFFLYFNLLEK